jgi:hypothetical protein
VDGLHDAAAFMRTFPYPQAWNKPIHIVNSSIWTEDAWFIGVNGLGIFVPTEMLVFSANSIICQ